MNGATEFCLTCICRWGKFEAVKVQKQEGPPTVPTLEGLVFRCGANHNRRKCYG
jgi:hypothetical protein